MNPQQPAGPHALEPVPELADAPTPKLTPPAIADSPDALKPELTDPWAHWADQHDTDDANDSAAREGDVDWAEL